MRKDITSMLRHECCRVILNCNQNLRTSCEDQTLLQLSVIIVNYNVKHFLEQCLHSVQAAASGLKCEIIVVDNQSTDNSKAYLVPRFPHVNFIWNEKNEGFAKACNIGLAASSGQLVLFLNPDTLLPADCFAKCLQFLDAHPQAGALGVRMIDGTGEFLPESKRAFPSPLTSLYKLFGLARLFPRSRTFARYHLGHLDQHQDHRVDVLAGAFMLIRKSVLDITGGFDENFFMYGEDVDLSYRVQQAGYFNYYFSGTAIIHFKGESTKRGSLNYVRLFYKAMSVFVQKHYGKSRARFFVLMVHIAIWVRAAMTALATFIRKAGLPIIDGGIILFSFWATKSVWNEYVKVNTLYQPAMLWVALPAFTILYLVAAWYAGLYDKWYRVSMQLKSTVAATLILLAVYALLPEQYRFSRAIILFGAILSFLLITVVRWLLGRTGILKANVVSTSAATIVAGNEVEYTGVLKIMSHAGQQQNIIGRAAVSALENETLGRWDHVNELNKTIPFTSVIFCLGELQTRDIVNFLPQLSHRISARFHATGSDSIVGSDSNESSGESVSTDIVYRLADPYYRRLKRLFDLLTAIAGIIAFPIHMLFIKKPINFLNNCLQVISGNKTWVGYAQRETSLPLLRQPVLACNGMPFVIQQRLPIENLSLVDHLYARDYDLSRDAGLLWKGYRRLGG